MTSRRGGFGRQLASTVAIPIGLIVAAFCAVGLMTIRGAEDRAVEGVEQQASALAASLSAGFGTELSRLADGGGAAAELRARLVETVADLPHWPRLDLFAAAPDGWRRVLTTRAFERPAAPPDWIEPGTTRAAARAEGARVTAVYPVPRTAGQSPALLLVELDAGGALRSVRGLEVALWITAVIATALAAALAHAAAQRVARPLKRLARVADELGHGRTAAATGLEADLPGELGAIGRRLTDMAASVQEREEGNRRLVEAFMQLDKLREEMLSTISHELRTPITSILAYGEILTSAAGAGSTDTTEYIEVVVQEARRLADVVEQVLDLSRYDLQPEELELAEIDPRELVGRAVASVATGIAARRITVVIDDDVALGPIMVDEMRTLRALVNVLGNAVRFAPIGSRLAVAFAPPSEETPASLTISDEGPGVADGERERIFDMFFQGARCGTDLPGGLGVGLPLARVCMRAQGGNLELVDSAAPGATFRLVFPAQTTLPRSAAQAAGVSS